MSKSLSWDFDIAALAVREDVGLVEVQRVFLVALQHHHVLEVENEVRTFVERRENGKRLLQFQRALTGIGIAGGSGLREVAEVQSLPSAGRCRCR